MLYCLELSVFFEEGEGRGQFILRIFPCSVSSNLFRKNMPSFSFPKKI